MPSCFRVNSAILQNNLATAYLNMPMTEDRRNLREAMAVQAFEEALRVVTLIDHPTEFAMLQNNLGNALQFASSEHGVENRLRALDAYDEALKVRRPDNTPALYANTIANKASCLLNLPDDATAPEAGNTNNVREALALYGEAEELLRACGEDAKALMLGDLRADIARELAASDAPALRSVRALQ